MTCFSTRVKGTFPCLHIHWCEKDPLVCVACLCAGVSERGFMWACLWFAKMFAWVCVSGGLSTIMQDYNIVLSLLWFSQAGWEVGWVFGVCRSPHKIAGGPWCRPQTASTHTESALDNTTSFEQQGGLVFREIILQLEDWFNLSCQQASVLLKCTWKNIESLPTRGSCSVADPHLWPWWDVQVLPQKINKVSHHISCFSFNFTLL